MQETEEICGQVRNMTDGFCIAEAQQYMWTRSGQIYVNSRYMVLVKPDIFHHICIYKSI